MPKHSNIYYEQKEKRADKQALAFSIFLALLVVVGITAQLIRYYYFI